MSQTYKNYEVLIIDANSTDNTLSIIATYQQKNRLIHVISEKDQGIYDAMNKGIKLAKGDWLYFLGSDDALHNNDILKTINGVTSQTKSKFIYGNVIIRGNNQWMTDGLIYDGKFDLKKILHKNISHQSIFYHNTLFKRFGYFNVEYKVRADYDFNLKCFGGKVNTHFINTVIASFSVGGQSSNYGDEKFDDEKVQNIINYFKNDIHKKEFISLRLFIRRSSFSHFTSWSFFRRVYFLLAYILLKIRTYL